MLPLEDGLPAAVIGDGFPPLSEFTLPLPPAPTTIE
jgi:hypothetical protein